MQLNQLDTEIWVSKIIYNIAVITLLNKIHADMLYGIKIVILI